MIYRYEGKEYHDDTPMIRYPFSKVVRFRQSVRGEIGATIDYVYPETGLKLRKFLKGKSIKEIIPLMDRLNSQGFDLESPRYSYEGIVMVMDYV